MVELKNGETYSGMLAACDGFMNLHLKNSVCTSKDGERFWKVSECFLRGNTVKYARLQEELVTLVKEEKPQGWCYIVSLMSISPSKSDWLALRILESAKRCLFHAHSTVLGTRASPATNPLRGVGVEAAAFPCVGGEVWTVAVGVLETARVFLEAATQAEGAPAEAQSLLCLLPALVFSLLPCGVLGAAVVEDVPDTHSCAV
ncbi:u6 snRNA associated sm-like protein [Cyclospora cayetanensis]|uniref:U6 snRNA-associated Sm-like protein LSm4 n=1 Tax=Cyclospora cayetanensis TaxID=88456 RepID=A0A1D3CZV1_9EIME|nr:u6 snRNA associated sm-like protein [Cyclospora cayetanensis]